MGWSVPEVPARGPVAAWSPWICLFILFFGICIALAWALLTAPAGGLSSLPSDARLLLTGYTLMAVMAAVTFYLLWWETQALGIWYWNSWRLNMHAAWQRQAHQHLCVVSRVMLTPDAQRIPRLIGLASEEEGEDKSTTLLPDEVLVPGISRFEQLCRKLIAQATSTLSRWYPAGGVTVIVQTSSDTEKTAQEQRERIIAIWQQQALPWKVTVQILPTTFPFEYWNKQLLERKHPVLVLALHYRQPGETQAEMAGALLLMPPSLLPSAARTDALKLFRAMPLQTNKLTAELKELRDMVQQPAEAIRLIWFSGLTAPQRQLLATATHGLSLHLSGLAPMAGLIDFDRGSEQYGHLASWLMMVAAAETADYETGSHWLVWADDKQAWAMAAGVETAVPYQRSEMALTAPFPAGGITLAVLLHSVLLWCLGSKYPVWLFSWWGASCVLLMLGIMLPGIALLLRKSVARLLLPAFIRTAAKQGSKVK